MVAVCHNAFNVIVRGIGGHAITVFSFLDINNWIKVLLLYYFVFWVIYGLLPKKLNMSNVQDILMCLIVLSFSLIDYFTSFKITLIWVVEPLGFAYGILAENCAESIRKWMGTQWMKKSICIGIVSCILGVAYLKFKPIFFLGAYLLKLLLGIAITLFIYEMLNKFKVGNKINAFLGSISYEVYILHGTVFLMLMRLNKEWNSGLYIIIAIAVTVILAWLLKQISSMLIKKF